MGFFSAYTGGKIVSVNGSEITNAWEIIYFNVQVFYSATLGDILIDGKANKIIFVIELITSAIFHLIVLALAIEKILQNRIKIQSS